MAKWIGLKLATWSFVWVFHMRAKACFPRHINREKTFPSMDFSSSREGSAARIM